MPLKQASVAILQRKTAEALDRANAANQSVLKLVFDQWNDSKRGVPNPLIRSGLFTTRVSEARATIKAEKIASLSNVDILYTGEELRQDDLTVWLSICNLGRNQPLGDPIYFTGYKLLKDMQWRMHSDSYEKLRGSIARLKVTSIQITQKNGRAGYAGSLIRDYAFDARDVNGRESFVVRLEPSVASLFGFDDTTLLEWNQRIRIGTKASLTLFLHAFYSSHQEPIPYSIAKLFELCKSEQKAYRNFKIRMRVSLETLITIGFLHSYVINKDIVHVKRLSFAVLN